jgi:hypothetical protein
MREHTHLHRSLHHAIEARRYVGSSFLALWPCAKLWTALNTAVLCSTVEQEKIKTPGAPVRQACGSPVCPHIVREFDSHETRLCYGPSALWMLGTYHGLGLGTHWHRLSLSSHTVATWEAMVLPSRSSSTKIPIILSTNKAQLV